MAGATGSLGIPSFNKHTTSFLSPNNNYCKVHYEVTQRDAEIVATVIQWLGSNCGMSFLQAALQKCGLRIEKERV